MMVLADVARVFVGYTYRGSLKGACHGDIAVVQMGDLNSDGQLPLAQLARADIRRVPAHQILQSGDLLFRARGLHNVARLVDDAPVRMICVAPLLVIRVTRQDLLLPAYCQWYINHSLTQKKIDDLARGEAIRMITAQALCGLEVMIPALARQQKIIAVDSLSRQVAAKEERLAIVRRNYCEMRLFEYARSGVWQTEPEAA